MEMEEEKTENIIPVNIETHMKTAYIDYSMSVIVSRALPDVRDGLKPVHRRILYGMYDLGMFHNSAHKKSARIVGEVMGKYHPHGDSSIYDALVRMAQDWSMRYTLVDGQGNFGSIDQDPPAAMRYTEARLSKISAEVLSDLDKDTVDWQLNFDDTLKEPQVLPTRIPNLLVNGSSGIAVGMATNMPPHNLSQVVDGCVAYIDATLRNEDVTVGDLMKHIKAPDFPTGGIIYGYEGVKEAFETGRGRIVMRGEAEIEELPNGHERIIVTSIPYQVNKADMIKKTADLVNEKKIEGISDINDESSREGMRVVYDLRRDANSTVVLNKLYQYTALQTSFSVNNIALVKGRPQVLNLKDLISLFIEHRHDVVVRRTEYELKKALERQHILEGLLIALDHIDEVIKVIRNSKSPDVAKEELMSRFGLSEIQSGAVLAMRLSQLTGLEGDKLRAEHAELAAKIEYLRSLLSSFEMRSELIKTELLEIKEKFGDEPKSKIVYSAGDFRIEDVISDDAMVITISHLGYIKRTLLSEYRVQGRGGRGSKGSDIRDEDFVEHLFTATAHDYMLFFTEKGRCYWMRVFEIPEGTKTSKGRAIQNMINIENGDKVCAYVNVKDLKDKEYVDNNYIVMCTKNGLIKKTSLTAYSRPRVNGVNAINIREDDRLLQAKLTDGNNVIVMGLKSGRAIRFPENKARAMGRNATGVRGVRLANENDEVIGMITLENEDYNILVVSEKGYGKRSNLEDYRETNRGGKGVKTLNVTEKTGNLIAIENVVDDNDLMIIKRSGVLIRLSVSDLRIMGRATQGVKLIRLEEGDTIASVAKVEREEDSDIEKVKPLDESELTPDDIIIADAIEEEEDDDIVDDEVGDDEIIEEEE